MSHDEVMDRTIITLSILMLILGAIVLLVSAGTPSRVGLITPACVVSFDSLDPS